MRSRHISILTLALLLLAACGGDGAGADSTTTAPPTTTATTSATVAPLTTPTATTAPTTPTTSLDPTLEAPDGFVRHVDTQYGFVMDLPTDWLTIGTDPGDIDEILELGGRVAGVDPELLDMARGAIEGGVALIAYDPAALGDTFATNLNVLRTERNGIGPNLYEAVVPGQLELFGAEDITTSRESLPAGEAVLTEFSTPVLGSRGLQYTIFADEHLWIITLSAVDPTGYADLLRSIVSSFGVA